MDEGPLVTRTPRLTGHERPGLSGQGNLGRVQLSFVTLGACAAEKPALGAMAQINSEDPFELWVRVRHSYEPSSIAKRRRLS